MIAVEVTPPVAVALVAAGQADPIDPVAFTWGIASTVGGFIALMSTGLLTLALIRMAGRA